MEIEFEFEDIEKEIEFMVEEYLETSLHLYSNKYFKEIMLGEILDYFERQSIIQGWSFSILSNGIDLEEYISKIMEDTFQYYNIPPRENIDTISLSSSDLVKENDLLLNGEKKNIKQRTPEWYELRYNCFSASAIWKLLDTPSTYNSLIFEKCKPFETQNYKHIVTNEYNPRNWGVKYEPVSIQIYSFKNPNTIVKTDYGCIPHPNYSFIGASPDGINIAPEKYGCMVEIKNIFNREIDGIPFEEYWIQMQIQMETCNLEECDFLETRFKEYETEDAFYQDQLTEFKGVILFFLAKNPEKENKFEYMPLYISLEKTAIELWIREMQDRFQEEYILYDRSYWYLDEYSCVNIKRNTSWFESVLPIIDSAWKIVEHERENGYEHRAPKRKGIPKEIDSSIKVIKLD
jgi:hypothetical protein